MENGQFSNIYIFVLYHYKHFTKETYGKFWILSRLMMSRPSDIWMTSRASCIFPALNALLLIWSLPLKLCQLEWNVESLKWKSCRSDKWVVQRGVYATHSFSPAQSTVVITLSQAGDSIPASNSNSQTIVPIQCLFEQGSTGPPKHSVSLLPCKQIARGKREFYCCLTWKDQSTACPHERSCEIELFIHGLGEWPVSQVLLQEHRECTGWGSTRDRCHRKMVIWTQTQLQNNWANYSTKPHVLQVQQRAKSPSRRRDALPWGESCKNNTHIKKATQYVQLGSEKPQTESFKILLYALKFAFQ